MRFQQGRHIEGSQNWQGQNYAVFRNYHSSGTIRGGGIAITAVTSCGCSEPRITLARVIGSLRGVTLRNAYYAWDGPIYAYNRLPPDQVIANVQAALQQQGYYHGEVDGLKDHLHVVRSQIISAITAFIQHRQSTSRRCNRSESHN